jgi:hypothetical protein
MDTFVQLYLAYRRTCSFWSFVRRIYFTNAQLEKKIIPTCTALVTGALSIGLYCYFYPEPKLQSAVMETALILLCFCTCLGATECALRRSFRDYYSREHYRDRMKMYGRDRQYWRYLILRDQLLGQTRASPQSLANALRDLEVHLSTVSERSIGSNIFLSGGVGLVVAVVGTWVVEKGDVRAVVGTVLALVFVLALVSFLLKMGTTEKARMLEFKRFLLWLQTDQQVA